MSEWYTAIGDEHQFEFDSVEVFEEGAREGENYVIASDVNCPFFERMKVEPEDLQSWFDYFHDLDPEWDKYKVVAAIILREDMKYDLQSCGMKMDEISLYQGNLVDYARENFRELEMADVDEETARNIMRYVDFGFYAESVLRHSNSEIMVFGEMWVYQDI